jgi:hypothetical protein
LSERFKHLPEFIFRCVEAQISYKDILQASSSALSCRSASSMGRLAGWGYLPGNRDRSRRTVECGEKYSRFVKLAMLNSREYERRRRSAHQRNREKSAGTLQVCEDFTLLPALLSPASCDCWIAEIFSAVATTSA